MALEQELIDQLLIDEYKKRLTPEQDAAVKILRSRGEFPEAFEGVTIKKNVIRGLKEAGKEAARMVLPISTAEQFMKKTSPQEGSLSKGFRYGTAAVSDVLSLAPAAQAFKQFRGVKVPGGKFGRVKPRHVAEAAEEAGFLAHQDQMLRLAPSRSAKEFYEQAVNEASLTGETFNATQTLAEIRKFLDRYSPTNVTKTKEVKATPDRTETRVVEKSTAFDPDPVRTTTKTTVSGTGTRGTVQEQERFLQGMEKAYQDLEAVQARLLEVGGAVPPSEWKSMHSRLQAAYNALKEDPRRGDMVSILEGMKKDLDQLASPAARYMKAGDIASRRESALEILDAAASSGATASMTEGGRFFKRVNSNKIIQELHAPANKYTMGSFSPAERKDMERVWGAISRIEELSDSAKSSVESALNTISPIRGVYIKTGGYSKGIDVPKSHGVELVNIAMMLPGGPKLLRSVTQKGILSQTGQLMITNFVLSQFRKMAAPQTVTEEE